MDMKVQGNAADRFTKGKLPLLLAGPQNRCKYAEKIKNFPMMGIEAPFSGLYAHCLVSTVYTTVILI
jgi:hypothetical protein